MNNQEIPKLFDSGLGWIIFQLVMNEKATKDLLQLEKEVKQSTK